MAAFNRLALAATGLAAFGLAVPAGAAPLPVLPSASEVSAHDGHALDAEGWRHRRYRRGPSAGDVIAGVAIIGTIAAIASASRQRDYRDRDYRDRDYRYRDYPYRNGDYREDYRRDMRGDYDDARGMERAVDMCIAQAERGRDRVEDIEESRRDRDGWYVSGRMRDGQGFSCRIDNDGRIRDVDLNGAAGARYDAPAPRYEDSDRSYNGARYDQAPAGGQYSDDVYARARAENLIDQRGYDYDDQRDGQTYAEPSVQSGPQPAYPGGPLPGEEFYDNSGGDDGRYDTANSPDFSQT